MKKKRTDAEEFMTYLKFHRLSLGMTQAEVAKRAHMAQGTYCEIEKGIKKPRPKLHKRLAEALGRPVEEFTGKLYGVDPREMSLAVPGVSTK